ncbi:MAG: hypothetical protein ACREP9_00370 [Candidatus Dormibacteraceae bacterium]
MPQTDLFFGRMQNTTPARGLDSRGNDGYQAPACRDGQIAKAMDSRLRGKDSKN